MKFNLHHILVDLVAGGLPLVMVYLRRFFAAIFFDFIKGFIVDKAMQIFKNKNNHILGVVVLCFGWLFFDAHRFKSEYRARLFLEDKAQLDSMIEIITNDPQDIKLPFLQYIKGLCDDKKTGLLTSAETVTNCVAVMNYLSNVKDNINMQ